MNADRLSDLGVVTSELVRIGNRGVERALAENRRLGIPSAFSFRGRIVYELPDGTLTETDPFASTAPERGERR